MSEEQTALEYFDGDSLAESVFLGKYAAKGETNPNQLHKRMAKEFSRIEKLYQKNEKINDNLSEYGKTRQPLTEERIFELFKDFKYIVCQGSVMAILGTDKIASLSNCVVIPSPNDAYNSIMWADTQLASLYKRRCGVGLDISKLRPQDSFVNNASKSSTGSVSFMERFSNTTREVSMNGRRGALMLTINVNHPDVTEFVHIKKDLTKVTGANISIKLNNEFLKAVENDEDYILKFPINTPCKSPDLDSMDYNKLYEIDSVVIKQKVYVKKIKAKELWNEIIKSAHQMAEPGLLFWDRMIDYSPDGVYEQYKPICTNPCFTGDNHILTLEGFKTFFELEDLDFEIIDSKGEIKDARVWKSGFKDVIEISTWGKHIFKCTPDHKFMTTEGEFEAKDLKGKRLLPLYKIKNTYNEFTCLGFLQGDGGLGRLSSGKHLGLEVNIGQDDDDIKKIFNISEEGSRTYYINGYNVLLRKLGFSSEQLPYRTLPITIDTWELDELKDFLTGLFSANGGVIKGHRVSFKSTCRGLIDKLQSLLKEKLNINSYVTTNKVKEIEFSNGTYLCKESYDLNISRFDEVLKFAESISFVHNYKRKDLEQLLLDKSPKVKNIKELGREYVYDFTIDGDNHWGVVAAINKWNNGFIVHNCSEIAMSNDSCRLIITNLYSFVDNPFTDKAKFNFKKFYEINYEAMRLMDDLVDLEVEHIDRILKKIDSDPESAEEKFIEKDTWKKLREMGLKGRRTGLGITALGDTLAALGLKYDSDEAIKMVDKIFKKKMESELECTIDLAILRGTFDGWNPELEKVS